MLSLHTRRRRMHGSMMAHHEGQVRQVFLGFTPPRIGYLLLRIPLRFPRKVLRPGRRGGGTAARAPRWQGRNAHLEIHEGYGVFLDHATFAHHPSLPPRGGGTLGIAGRARQQHLHKGSSGEDIEEESVVSSRSIRVSSSPAMELFTAALLLPSLTSGD